MTGGAIVGSRTLSRMRRRFLPLTTVVPLLVVGLLAGAATAQPGEEWTRTGALLDTVTGPTDDYPVTIDYDLYVPEGASAADPRPAMVVAHGFGNSKSVAEVTTLGAFFAAKGYVVITSSHQGFGGSSGCVALNSIDYDAKNVSSLIDVLAERDDVVMDGPGDPRVGMVGGSYGGGHQGLVAASDPRLDAIAPGRTWNSLQFSLVPNNLIGDGGLYDLQHYEQGVFKQGWTSLFYALGSAQPAQGNGGCDPITQQTLYPGQPPCSGFDPAVCPIFASLAATGDVSQAQREFVERSSVTSFVEGVDVPVLLTQGQSDTLFRPLEATATFHQLRADGNDDVFLLWNWGGHGYQPLPGEGEPYSGAFGDTDEAQEAFRATYFATRFSAFFDHYLREEGHPGPRFAFHRDWVQEPEVDPEVSVQLAHTAYAESGRVPTNDGPVFTLTDDGLVAGTVEDPQLTASILAPAGGAPAAHSETPNFTGAGQPGAAVAPTEVEGQHVAFDTAPLTAPAITVGFPTLRIGLSNANGQDAIVFTKLYDVAPDGSATLIRRLVAASRIPASDLPGTVELRVPGVAHRFEAGHAIRLVVATTDDSYRNASVADQITLTTDPADPSVLRLPLEGGDTVGRISGPDRIGTAIALSEHAFGTATEAVVTGADTFADALSAGPLAAALDGPLLLTARDRLDPRVAADLRRLGVQRVHVVGGPAAVGPPVTAALTDLGIEVVAVAGEDRFATSQAVARRLAQLAGGQVESAVLARGDDFADALGAGSLAAVHGIPIVLVDEPRTGAVAALLADLTPDGAEVLVAGGEDAVPSSVASAIGRPTRRLAGPDRYATAAALASEFALTDLPLNLVGAEPLLLASGETFPDALAAVPAAHALHGMVLTIPPAGIAGSSDTAAFLREVAGAAHTAFLVGGTVPLPEDLRTTVAPFLVASASS